MLEDLKTKSAKNDLKGIWKTIKLASNMAPSSNPQNDVKCPIDPDVINEHFVTTDPRIQSKTASHKNLDYKEFMPNVPPEITLNEFIEVTSDEAMAYIDSFSSS